MIGNSNDETNFQHKLLLTNNQVSKIRKAFGNGLSANIKFCWCCKKIADVSRKFLPDPKVNLPGPTSFEVGITQ